eukprot:5720181-Amphidinium_carterae.1
MAPHSKFHKAVLLGIFIFGYAPEEGMTDGAVAESAPKQAPPLEVTTKPFKAREGIDFVNVDRNKATAETMRLLAKVHCALGHLDVPSMIRLLSSQGATMATLETLKCMRCEYCDRHRRTPHQRVAAFKPSRHFGDVIQADVVFIADLHRDKHPVLGCLGMIDCGTHLHVAKRLPD